MALEQVIASSGSLDKYLAAMKQRYRAARHAKVLDGVGTSNAAAAAIASQMIALPREVWEERVLRPLITTESIDDEFFNELLGDLVALDHRNYS